MGVVEQHKRLFHNSCVFSKRCANLKLRTFFYLQHNIFTDPTFIRYDTKSNHTIHSRLCLWCSSKTLYTQFRQILNYTFTCIFLPSKHCQFNKITYLCNVERIKSNAEVRLRTAPQGYRQAPDKLRTLTTSGVSI